MCAWVVVLDAFLEIRSGAQQVFLVAKTLIRELDASILAPWVSLGTSGRTCARIDFFNDFGLLLKPHFESCLGPGHRGLEIRCCLRFQFHVAFDTEFKSERGALGA